MNQDENRTLGRIEGKLDEVLPIIHEIPRVYATKSEVKPVKSIVYGAVAIVLTTFMGTLVVLAFN